jgi:hypothetical protein
MTSLGGSRGVDETKVELPGVSPSGSSSGASGPNGSRRSQGGDETDSSAAPVPGDYSESPQVRDSDTSRELSLGLASYSSLR